MSEMNHGDQSSIHTFEQALANASAPRKGNKLNKQSTDIQKKYSKLLRTNKHLMDKISTMEKRFAALNAQLQIPNKLISDNSFASLDNGTTDDMITVTMSESTSNQTNKFNLTKRTAPDQQNAPAKKSKTSTLSIPTPSSQSASASAKVLPTASTEPKPKNNIKPPPIVASNLDCKSTAKILSDSIGPNAFSFRRVGSNTTHINTKSIEDFRSVRSILEQSNAEHHTFTPKQEQNNNIVLRHLDSSYDENDITEAINMLALDIIIEKIMKLPTQSNNLWLIQLKAGSNAKQLLDQHYLLHQKVRFEWKKRNDIAQCKNCQQIGHTARNCKHKYRCVKCKDDHRPGMCPRTNNKHLTETTLPSCVNCNADDHPANFRGCPYFAKAIQRKQSAAAKSTTTPTIEHQTTTSFRSQNVSYSSAVANRLTNTTASSSSAPKPSNASSTLTPPSVFAFLDAECIKFYGNTFVVINTKFREFIPAYNNLPDSERCNALTNFIASLYQ